MTTPGGRGWLARLALDRPEARAWAMYDWANSAFMTTVIAAVFPIYYKEIAAIDLDDKATSLSYSLATGAALLIAAVAAPLLGALADQRGVRKQLLIVFALFGAISTGGLFFIEHGDWLPAMILFGAANLGAAASLVFYDSLLPHVARPEEMDRLSTSGFALGYVGGGLLLAANLAWIQKPDWFGLPPGDASNPTDQTLPVRLAFLSVAVWWVLFTIPLWRKVKEPPRARETGDVKGFEIRVGAIRRTGGGWRVLLLPLQLAGVAFLLLLRAAVVFLQRHGGVLGGYAVLLVRVVYELREYRQAMRMLVAFLLFNDGILTVIRMAALYAAIRNLDSSVVIGTILVVQFVGIPFAFLFGQLSSRFGAKNLILAGLGVYCGISVLAFFMSSSWHFVALGFLVATVQGGTQGLSRSLFTSLIPRHRSGEFLGFFAIAEKFAGVFGPLVFALVISLSGSVQNAILSVIPFFVIGGFLLMGVDVATGRRIARAAEKEAVSC
jgi:MFS transporter, UMF1 family